MRALTWIRANHLPGEGIRVQSGHPRAYPEVSGYLVPTLLAYGETALADEVTRWLIAIQRPDGSFPDPDQGKSYVFDTGQVLRGLLAARDRIAGAAEAARRAADYLVGRMVDGGSSGFGVEYSGKWWVETSQLYVLPALVEAAAALGEPAYRQTALRAADYYATRPDFLRKGELTHFLAYQLEALIDLGRGELARPLLDRLARSQRRGGAVRGAGWRRWVCPPGLAQLALCWYKLDWAEPADRAMAWLDRHQSPGGGWPGSVGLGAAYKPDVEVSWAPKFYLDAHLWRVQAYFDRHAGEYPAEVEADDGRLQAVLDYVADGDRVLEAGCGKGRFLKAVAAARPGVHLTGVDPSAALAAHLPAEIMRIIGRSESIPLAAASFDAVFSVEALEHSANPRQAIAEMARVCRPGGHLVVVDKQQAHWGRLKCPSWEYWPGYDEVLGWLAPFCDSVAAEAVSYDGKPADGLFIAWRGRRKGSG